MIVGAESEICALLVRVRDLLLTADDLVRPDTEYLRSELARLLAQVDILEGKVEKERRMVRDKVELGSI